MFYNCLYAVIFLLACTYTFVTYSLELATVVLDISFVGALQEHSIQ